MSSSAGRLRTIILENRVLVVLSSVLSLLLFGYFMLWHVSIIVLGSGFSIRDVADQFRAAVLWYLLTSVLVSCIVLAAFIFVKNTAARIAVAIIFLFLFFLSEITRVIDWGTLYFNGTHVDANFWAHAGYADGLVFLLTREALMLFASLVLFFAVILIMLKKIYIVTAPESDA